MKNILLIFTLVITSIGPSVARDRDDRRHVRKQNRERQEARRDRHERRRETRNRREERRRDDRVNRDRRHRDTRVDRQRRHDRRVDNRRDRNDRRYDRRNHRRDYRTYRHRPHRERRVHNRRWSHPRQYHRSISRYDIYLNRWLRVSIGLGNGYHWYNDYPYYVYNGYRHRYSTVDYCEYELVDSYTDDVYTTFSYQRCSTGYDVCADLRDDLNDYEWDNRYFCAESYQY